jgi:predicted MFS family arabinose efflux permease
MFSRVTSVILPERGILITTKAISALSVPAGNVMSGSRQQPESRGYAWFVLCVLTLVYTFNFIDRQILVILQEPIKAELDLSDAQLGLLSGFSFALIYVVAGIPIAWLADRSNRRNIVACSLAIWSGMTAVSGLVSNFGQLVAARLGVGLGEAGGSPPAHSLLSDYFPPDQRGSALSFYSAGIYLGVLAGFAGGGYVAETFGWRMAFFVVGAPGILLALALPFLIKEPLRGRLDLAHSENKPTFSQTLSAITGRRTFCLVAFGCAFTAFISYGNGNFFPSYLMRNHDMTISEVGFALAAVSGVAGAVGTFGGGVLADRLGKTEKRWYLWVPVLGNVLALPLMAYAILSENTDLLLYVLFPANILNSLYLGPSIALCHLLVSPGMRAMASAILFLVINMIGLGLGPLVVGVLSDAYEPLLGAQNLRAAMLSVLGCGFVVGNLCFLLAGTQLTEQLAIAGGDR